MSLESAMTCWPGVAGLLAFFLGCYTLAAEDPPPAAAPAAAPAAKPAAKPALPPETLVMPTRDIFPQEVLNGEFVNNVSKPFDDPTLAFQITARKTWKWETLRVRVKASDVDFLPIAIVHGPDAGGVAVTLQAGYRIVEREVAVEDYLEAYAQGLGYQILKEQWGTYSDRQVYEILARTDFNGVDCLVRMALSRDHNRFFLVCGFSAASEYLNFAKDIGVALVSFHLLQPTGKKYSEEVCEQRLDAPNLSFVYPKSWTAKVAKNAPKGISVCDVSHGNETAGLVGWIRVKAHSRAVYPSGAAPAYLASFREDLADAGFLPDVPIFDAPIAPSGKFLAGGRFLIMPATKDGKVSEVRLVILPTQDAWLVLSLLSPPRDRGPVEWMINKRAFEIVRDTLSPE